MSAIQRWYFETQDEAYTYKAGIDGNVILDDQWCKAKDVAELERVLAEQSATHQVIVGGLLKQLDGKNALIGRLQDDVMRLSRGQR